MYNAHWHAQNHQKSPQATGTLFSYPHVHSKQVKKKKKKEKPLKSSRDQRTFLHRSYDAQVNFPMLMMHAIGTKKTHGTLTLLKHVIEAQESSVLCTTKSCMLVLQL